MKLPRPALPLLVLYLTRSRKIVHRTRFQKLVFLVEHEVPEVKNYFRKSYRWKPYYYGPFSPQLLDDLVLLNFYGFIDVDEGVEEEPGDDSAPTIFYLTEKGVKYVEKRVIQILPKELTDKLRELVNKYNDMRLRDLLKYVYEKYPEYAVKSKIRDIILGSRK